MKDRNEQFILLAERIRQACLKAAKEGFREASMSGLCSEGAIEAAVGAIQSVDVEKIVRQAET